MVIGETSFPVTVQASSLCLQSVHAGGRMAEGEKSHVFYSQMVLIATLTLTEVREREETGLGCWELSGGG